MADNGTLGFEEATEIVADLAREHASRTGHLPDVVVMLGGTALAARAVRLLSRDVDVFLNVVDDDAVAAVTARYARRYGPTFKIDATPSENIWGAITLKDIAASPAVCAVETPYGDVEIRALTIETLYLVKAAANREKDRADLVNLSKKTTYADVIARARQVFPWYGDRQAFPDFVERLGRFVSEHFRTPLSQVDRDFGLPSSMAAKVVQIRQGLEAQYWPVLKALMIAAPQHLAFNPRQPERVSFDARKAGAPDDVIQVLRKNPRQAADVAADALKIADPARHLQRLQAMKRARSGRGPGD